MRICFLNLNNNNYLPHSISSTFLGILIFYSYKSLGLFIFKHYLHSIFY